MGDPGENEMGKRRPATGRRVCQMDTWHFDTVGILERGG